MEGLRFLKGRQAVQGTFVIDINAMVFGMPRAAIQRGAAQRVLSPAGIVDAIKSLHRERKRPNSK